MLTMKKLINFFIRIAIFGGLTALSTEFWIKKRGLVHHIYE